MAMNPYEIAFAHGLLRVRKVAIVDLGDFLTRHGAGPGTLRAVAAIEEGLGLLKQVIQDEGRPGPTTVRLPHARAGSPQ
jgi:hypothetical protein